MKKNAVVGHHVSDEFFSPGDLNARDYVALPDPKGIVCAGDDRPCMAHRLLEDGLWMSSLFEISA